MRTGIITLLLALALTGCGSDDDQNDADDQGSSPVLYDNAEIVEHIDFEDTGSGYAQTTLPDGEICEALILSDAGAVELYADAGDTVATNPEGTVGAKIISVSARSCFELVTERLADFP